MNLSKWQHLQPSYLPTEIFKDIGDLLINVLLNTSVKECPLGPLEPVVVGVVGEGSLKVTHKVTPTFLPKSLRSLLYIMLGEFWDLKIIICRSLLHPSK